MISKIYLDGIKSGFATFETNSPNWKVWNAKYLPFARITIEKKGEILGWGALSPTSNREAYAGVAEVSVYVSPHFQGKGLGKNILNKLISISEENNYWTLQSSIMPNNKASIVMHEQCGFRKIGYREKIAQLNRIWLDNIIFERRSKIVGI